MTPLQQAQYIVEHGIYTDDANVMACEVNAPGDDTFFLIDAAQVLLMAKALVALDNDRQSALETVQQILVAVEQLEQVR